MFRKLKNSDCKVVVEKGHPFEFVFAVWGLVSVLEGLVEVVEVLCLMLIVQDSV